MKNQNILIEILKLLGCVILGWILWLFIFAATSPQESSGVAEPFVGASVIFGIITGFIVGLGIKFNSVHRMKQHIFSMKSNIRIVEERSDKLLDKANRVADKYMSHEMAVQLGVASTRTPVAPADKKKLIKNSHEFKTAIESYPDLKANESIMELLNQIKDCENTVANCKIDFNSSVEVYNATIHSFPAMLFRKIAGFKDLDYLDSSIENSLISDEALGI